jgi:osmotically-inducible protein OsmY
MVMTTMLVRSDAEIQRDVLRELRWDTRVEETDVGVEVDQGIVTLTGTVGSYAKRMAAQQAAHRVAGVRDVANDVEVHISGSKQRTDTEIAQAVRHALEWNVHVPGDDIETTVSKGWVTLDGTVDYWSHKLEAEHAVLPLTGVRGVTNNIIVAASEVSSAQIHDSIEEALRRRAEREADDIQIKIVDGTVRLSGRVHSYRERRAIIGAASHAPGVRGVEDHLILEPYS